MIAAYHLLWTIYGYWLPNDPRGSRSRIVAGESIADLGELHFERKRIQPSGKELRAFHRSAAEALKHELRQLSTREISSVGSAFGDVIKARSYTCYACAIMPDHVHLLIRRHRDSAPAMIAELQRASRNSVGEVGERPMEHPVWGGPGWKVYLETREDIERVVRYVEGNPRKSKLPAQHWDFVTKYDGWLPVQVSDRRPAKSQAKNRPERGG